MAHPLELAEPNVIDEELTRSCITTVEEMSIQEDRKQEMKTETELHHVQVTRTRWLAGRSCVGKGGMNVCLLPRVLLPRHADVGEKK